MTNLQASQTFRARPGYPLTGTGNAWKFIRARIANALSTYANDRAIGRPTGLDDRTLMDIGVTGLGIREAALVERNELPQLRLMTSSPTGATESRRSA